PGRHPDAVTSRQPSTKFTGDQLRTDRKITHREWARGSGPGPGVVIGPGQGRYGLPGLGDGDGVAQQRFDLPDVVAELAVGVGAGRVVAGAEGGEPRGRVSEQLPDDDQDGTGHGDLGLGLAAAAGDPAVPLAEEGGGAGRVVRGLAEGAAQPGVAPALL